TMGTGDEDNREIASESDVLDKSNVEETAPETEDSLEDIYPTLTEAEQITEPSMKEHAAPESDDAESANFRLQRSDENEMERLHRDFVRQMRAIVAENAEFGVHLGLEIDALDDATKIQNVEDRRKAILASMKKLSESHTQLAKKFDTAQTYLSIIESDKQKLSDELDRARMLSLTDELTSLPNRRAFMRRMDDEVSRVKRYGFPLSLVLIDIDHFKQVNDKYGHAAGDKVLRIYSEKILSIFRHHDMIARYGGEEFAVLLPNTDLDGVLRALDKVKSTVPKVQCKIGGMTINAPTFSAGVTEYRAPETPTQFIERADHALYRAKRLGRNRIEVEQKDNEHDVLDQT
ncbi:GGDEF domain-containing protein, partial [Kaarinaea lacus]